jgi:hypothetical protein
MKKAIAFISSNFSTFLVGLVFSLGCGCCCECENEQVSFITIDLSFFPAYPGRICSIPVPAGALTNIGANILGERDNPEGSTSYYLWVEFETCCNEFLDSPEFDELVQAGTARQVPVFPGDAEYYEIQICLNTTAGGTSVTFPIPTSSSGSTIHGGQIVVKYYEPCMPTNGDCESPSPVCGTTSTPNYRPVYKTRALVPWSKSDPYADVSSFALLTYLVTQCESDLFEEEFCK